MGMGVWRILCHTEWDFVVLAVISFIPPSRQHLLNPAPGQHTFTTPRSDKQMSPGSTIHYTSHILMHTHYKGKNFPALNQSGLS